MPTILSTPYYQDELVTLYHGDCLEITEWLAADVLVSDVPYGMAFSSGHSGQFGKSEIASDENTDARDIALGMWGSEKPALIFGRWSVKRPNGTKQILTWDKGEHVGMGDLNIPWKPTTEEIYVLGRWPKREVGRDGAVIRSFAIAGSVKPNMGRPGMGRNHPTEKPVPLLEYLISRTPSGIVADPFMGAGSGVIAARNLGRRVIGVEIREDYCETTAKRLQQQAFDFGEIA
jgi:DNA modification methylase